ncbi:MAG: cell division protein ZapE [Planctomycetota bacterium]|nr:MAG: cell division protein ZapE [Planctomycetota bacterium]
MSAPATTTEPLIQIAEQRLARSALRRLRKPTAAGKGRLLYLVGPAGSGKSALLAESFRELPSSQVPPLQVTAAEFAAQLAEASSNQQLPVFQERFRSVSVLVCEDVQALERRPETLRQLLTVIDELLAHGSDVLVTSTKLPGQFESFPAKLVSRFRGGTVIGIKPPGPDSRAELLRLFCRQRRLSISRDALALLAESLEASPRELIGVITQLAERRRPLKRADIEDFLQRELPNKSITPLKVSRAVAKDFGIALSALRSRRRSQALVLPRQCAMWLCRKLCHLSYPELGAFFDRQHSSVIHAVRKLETRIENEPALRQRIARLESDCR